MNGADRNGGFHYLMIVLQGATMSDLAGISIASNHLAGVVAGLVAATAKSQTQEKKSRWPGDKPGHAANFRFDKCRPGDTIARCPNAAHLCCRRRAGTRDGSR
jgi:hypothetical protein